MQPPARIAGSGDLPALTAACRQHPLIPLRHLQYLHGMFRLSTRRLADAAPKLPLLSNPYKAQK